MPESSPIPTLLAFLICESVITDLETQKKTLVGLFDRVLAANTPVGMNLGIYAKLVEGRGHYDFRIRMVSLKDEALVFEVPIAGEWTTAEAPFEMGINIRGMAIPAFGNYEFQLYSQDVYLGRAVFAVHNMQMPPVVG